MLKNLCMTCDQVVTAPDAARGDEVPCPHCGARNLMLAAEDVAAQVEEEQRRDRRDFSNNNGSETAASKATDTLATLPQSILSDASLAGLAAAFRETPAVRRLRDLSDLLLIFAYLEGVLALGLGALPLFVTSWPLEWQLVSLLCGGLAAALVFLTFKFLSELVQALSDRAAGQRALHDQLREILTMLREREEL